MNHYDPESQEKKWHEVWEQAGVHNTPRDATRENKHYILPQLPYPSGAGLHVGHAEVYTACDIYARFCRMRGKRVLQVIGWDSFGLPAENYAIKTNVHPQTSTERAIDKFRAQIKRLGISVDWDREVASHKPDYYTWTQWFFLLMYKRGLAYRKSQLVNWCESCKTVLANEQVVNGACERCDTQVVHKEMEQWYLKITAYADRLLEDLKKIDWPEETKKRQADWIGRSEGAYIDFAVSSETSSVSSRISPVLSRVSSRTNVRDPADSGTEDRHHTLRVFTTRPDTLFGATYMVLAPEHALIDAWKETIENWDEVEAYRAQTSAKTELERQHLEKTKTGVEIRGIKAVNPANNEEIPMWIADYVLASYGTGAIMAVPAHDERDFEFAKKYKLPIKAVIEGGDGGAAYIGDGHVINSDFMNGMDIKEAKRAIIEWLEQHGAGERAVHYKLRDWSVSRQRFWGAPIPMLYDENGNLHPVPEEDLPVMLPNDVDFKPTGQSPLTYSDEFEHGVEERYGKGWKREPDTLDTFMCSSWYYYRYLDPHNDRAFASPESLKTWMPVDFYLGGPEHVNGHLLYARFFTKVLFDAGYIDFDEPFSVHRHQGLILGEDGRKMSKRWGNVINPDDVVDEFGADTLRVYEMFMGPLEHDKPWSTDGVRGVRRFLDRVFKLHEKVADEAASATDNAIEKILHQTIKKVTSDTAALQFNTAIAQLMSFVNACAQVETINRGQYHTLLILLAPYAPHIAEELWHLTGGERLVVQQKWPAYSDEIAAEEEIELVMQINGKIRDRKMVPAGLSDAELERIARTSEKISAALRGREPQKIIVVRGRLVNIVI